MDEDKIFSDIRNNLVEKKSFVTYSWLQKNFDVSPSESQILLKKYINLNKEFIATYLNYSTEDHINHVLSISDCLSENNTIISLKIKELDSLDAIKFHNANIELDNKNPPIVSDDIYLLSNENAPVKEIKHDKPVEQKPLIDSISQIPCKPATINTMKSLNSIKKFTTSTSNKDTKAKDDVIPVTQVSPVKSKHASTKSEKKLEVITFEALTQSDIIIKRSPKKDKSKNSNTKSRLFENFENVSPKKKSSRRRRLIVESDEDEENERILVNESIEEIKPVVTLKSHPSKRFKTDGKQKRVDPEIAVKKENLGTNSTAMFKKVEKTYKDEDGFLVVEKVLMPVNSDEKVDLSKTRSKIESTQSAIPLKVEKKIGKRSLSKQAESKGKQTNIMSFFQKNN